MFVAAVSVAEAQKLKAVDDILRTGPLQTMRKNIIRNDTIKGGSYSWRIISSSMPGCGTAVVSGDHLVFTPSINCRNISFDIKYELTSRNIKDTATIHIIVADFNRPVNIIDPDVECAENMQEGITFGIRQKYMIEPKASTGDWIDGMVAPLVGDLNGDGKPEIVIMGNTGDNGASAYTYMRYINIYNGQTGDRICHYNFVAAGDAPEMSMGGNWHRPPSSLALADVDNDGISEIIFCHSLNGNVIAFKPNFSTNPVTLHKKWDGKTNNGVKVNYKSPITSTNDDIYGYPHPYVADLNADGIPEVIVYNKIFNGSNGRLLMAWQADAPKSSPKNSDYTSSSGLKEQHPSGSPVTYTNATDIKNVAMTGRRPASTNDADRYLAVPAIVDIDGDGQQEIITGNRIHKFKFNSLVDHTLNTYYTIEGPQSVSVTESNGNTRYWLSDGFTRVADVDGDGQLDIIVACFGNSGAGGNVKIIVYVWDMDNLNYVKACVSFRSNGDGFSNFSIPFIGDINGKIDGYDHQSTSWTKKLPEICILAGSIFIDRDNNQFDRTGVMFHPKTDGTIRRGVGMDNNNTSANNRRFNRSYSTTAGNISGHIIGLTWDNSSSAVEQRLKLSWAMEHDDVSANTGITLFDFNNDNAADLCYRGARTLRVISPAKSGKDYVELSENELSPNTSIMFKTTVYSATAFEYPVIADVNMDGSADIVVTNSGVDSRDASRGWIEVYEYSGQRWAPCPPVWNQGMYDPTQIREDMKINARPTSILTTYTKNGDLIRPYNGSWMQAPIVKEGADFVPVVRMPDAAIVDMKVVANGGTSATVTLTIRNDGSATINEQMPIAFYNGGASGKTIAGGATLIKTVRIGVDIFAGEKVTVQYTLTGEYRGLLIWARITDNGSFFPADGYLECDLTNNVFSGSHCPELVVTTSVTPSDTTLCGNRSVKLSVSANCSTTTKYQWYRNDEIIDSATSQTYNATEAGEYRCYVNCGPVCRTFSSSIIVKRSNLPNARVVDKPVLRYDASTDSLFISIKVENAGDADFKNPFKITVYKNAKGNALKYTSSYKHSITAGDIVEISFGIPAFKASWYDNEYTSLFINLNDDGDGDDQTVCYSGERGITTGRAIAVDDRFIIMQNSDSNPIHLGANDILLCPDEDLTATIVTGTPKHGNCNIRNDTAIYTPSANYIGNDTIVYTLDCDGHRSIATVYILVQGKPTIADIDKPICPGTELELTATYITGCPINDTLIYRWEFRSINGNVWNTLEHDTLTISNCSTVVTVERKLTIAAVSESEVGYYRISMGGTSDIAIVSDSVAVNIVKKIIMPDIRIDVCPSPLRKINLTAFIDTVDDVAFTWEKVNPFSPNIKATTGEINTADISFKGTYTYRYSAVSCVPSSSIAYVHVLSNRLVRKIDTIAICKERDVSHSINLNRILGLELGGTWSRDIASDPDDAVKDNITTFPTSSNYHGSMIFNGHQAWLTATDSSYDIIYRGITAKRFMFKYTADVDNCVNAEHTLVVVITDDEL
jgi:hypothetical protein